MFQLKKLEYEYCRYKLEVQVMDEYGILCYGIKIAMILLEYQLLI